MICSSFPMLCKDMLGAIFGAQKYIDNYNRSDFIAGHDPGCLNFNFDSRYKYQEFTTFRINYQEWKILAIRSWRC